MVRDPDWQLVAERTRRQGNRLLAAERLTARAQCPARLDPADPTTRCDLTDGHGTAHRHTWWPAGLGPERYLDWT